jgi:hypothetical protein
MSGFFSTSTPQQPNYTGLQIQTAAAILPIPLCFGLCKLAPNIIWWNGFTQSGGPKGAKGGIFTPQSNTPTYQADVMMGLCEGPIAGIGLIWKGMQLYDLADLNSEGTGGTKSGAEMVGPAVSLFTGTTPQTPWSFLTSVYPSQALGYQGTAYIAAPSYYLTAGATLDPHNFEIQGQLYATGFNGLDADPAQLFYEFLTNAQWGAGFPASAIDYASIIGSSGDASYSSYCAAVGLALSPCLSSVETASSVLQRWLQLTNTAAIWSGGLLKLVPYGDTAIVAGTQISITEPIEIPIGVPDASGAYPSDVTVRVTFSPQIVSITSVTDSVTDTVYTEVGSNPTAWQYSLADGVFTFNAFNSSSVVDIDYVYAIPCSFTPNLTPAVQLDDDDYCHDDDKDPIQVDITDPFEAYNVWRLEISDRNNAYNTTPQEARDQSAQDEWGLRVASTVTAHEICLPQIGIISAQLMLQRGLYIRNTYKFTLSWEYIALDPMDIVGITDSLLGLDQTPVRIVTIDENDQGLLDVTAEELPPGIGTAARYPAATAVGTRVVTNAPAAAVNTPMVYEPPSALIGSTPQVWIGASASLDGAADPNWGGCNVFLSTDGATYGQIGTITQAAKQGVLTSSLSAYSSANPDTTHTLAVDMAESGGVMASSTDLNAELGVTLCLVGSELLSYATSTLTSANNYDLTYLYRGLYGTTAALQASASPFCLLDDLSIFKFDLPPQFIGVPLYIKLQSFNVFGLNQQPLSSCAVYNYTPTGAGLPLGPVMTVLAGGANANLGNAGSVTSTESLGAASPAMLSVNLGNAH